MTIRVVVADDQALVRSGFTMLLAGEPDFEVVGEASNGVEAVALVASEHPDVILMDIRMPVMDGLEATRRISEDPLLATTRILILTTFDLDEYVHEGLRAGASGFLLKDTMPVDLIQAVRVVAAGDALIAPRIMRRLIEEFVRRPEPAGAAAATAALDQLTDRERRCSNSSPRVNRTPRSPPRSTSPRNRQDPREPSVDETRRSRPGPARRDRLRNRCGAAGRLSG